jgi:hypothetical protein
VGQPETGPQNHCRKSFLKSAAERFPNGSRHRAGDLPAADAPGLKCPVLQNLGFMIWPSRDPEVFRMRVLQRQLQNRLDYT